MPAEENQEAEQEYQDLWTLYSPLISGGWKCLSFNLFSKSHPPKLLAQPHGPTPLGRLYISPRGWLAVHLAAVPDRDVASDKKKDEEDDHVNVNGGLAMYCGYLKLYRRGGGGEDDGQEELYWRTVVEVSSDSNLIGGVQERKVVFEEMERKKKSDGDSGGSDGGEEEEEEKSYYMILEPKQDWIMEVCNILEFLFFFFFPYRLLLAGWRWLDWIPFFHFLYPPFVFSRLFSFGKNGNDFFFLTLNSRLSNSPTLQLTNQKKIPLCGIQ